MTRWLWMVLAAAAVTWAAPAPENPFDFAAPDALTHISGNNGDSTWAIVDHGAGKSLEVTCPPGKNAWPGVTLKPAGDTWDLSKFGRMEADVVNESTEKLTLALRVDNAGDWTKNPWSSENAYLDPGKSATITVWFGWSWGNRGFALDPAKVTELLVFTTKPKKEIKFRIDALRAAGKPGDKPHGVIEALRPAGGVLFDAAAGGPHRSGTAIKAPEGAIWDLSAYDQAEFALRNPGDQPASVVCRVENQWSDGVHNCVSAPATLAPGETRTVAVPFAQTKPWDGVDKLAGSQFGSDTVYDVFVGPAKPGAGGAVDVLGVKASVSAPPAPPAWLGQRPPVEGEWTKTLDDEFDGPKIDDAKWTLPDHQWYGGWGLPDGSKLSIWDHSAIETAANAYIEDDQLKLRCEKIPPELAAKLKDVKQLDNWDGSHMTGDGVKGELGGRKYLTSVVTTYDKFAQCYGYFEAKLKPSTVTGMWPAFWMMPDRGKDAGVWYKRGDTANGGMEFDIWEFLTRFGPFRYNVALHWDGYEKNHKSVGSDRVYCRPDKDGWITAGFLWQPGKVTWYANGQVVASWTNDRVSKLPAYLMFTFPTGGWGTRGIEDESKLPDTFCVKYVRVWQNGAWK